VPDKSVARSICLFEPAAQLPIRLTTSCLIPMPDTCPGPCSGAARGGVTPQAPMPAHISACALRSAGWLDVVVKGRPYCRHSYRPICHAFADHATPPKIMLTPWRNDVMSILPHRNIILFARSMIVCRSRRAKRCARRLQAAMRSDMIRAAMVRRACVRARVVRMRCCRHDYRHNTGRFHARQ